MILQQAHSQTALKAADQCIYCGGIDDLSDEHVIPYGLGGNIYVPRASCQPCSAITSRFERSVLKGFMQRARLAGKMASYRRSRQPKDLTVTLLDGETPHEIVVPREEASAVLQLPTFESPRFLAGLPLIDGINACGSETIGFGDVEGVVRKHSATGFRQTDDISAVEFARMLAKIGYSFTVGIYGVIPLPAVFVLSLIRGTSQDAGHWVGSGQFETEGEKAGAQHVLTHSVCKSDIREMSVLVARIKLFASAGATGYEVVVCKLDDLPCKNAFSAP